MDENLHAWLAEDQAKGMAKAKAKAKAKGKAAYRRTRLGEGLAARLPDVGTIPPAPAPAPLHASLTTTDHA